MSKLDTFSFFFKKHPLVRTISLAMILAILSGISPLIRLVFQRPPEVTLISPAIGSPGDILTIAGKHFGEERGERSYVEIAGSRLTASSYVSWTDDQIFVELPSSVQNGLVYVVTGAGKSDAKIFTNKATVPTPIQVDPFTASPFIQIIQERNIPVGSIITIQGRNFGSSRNTSQVYFTRASEDFVNTRDNVVCLDSDFDYEFWDDTEIRVRVPDGATSGMIHVTTDKGQSNSVQLDISSRLGLKTYTGKRTYLITSMVDLTNIETEGESTITLRVPRPIITASQPSVELFSSKPTPFIADFNNTIVHQYLFTKAKDLVESVKHEFVVSSYAIQTSVREYAVSDFSETDRLLYITGTKADELIPSDNGELVSLVRRIVGSEENPYRRAKLIYSYLLENIELLQGMQQNTIAPLEALEEGQADAYNLNILFCAMLRASSIPAMPISGILIDKNGATQAHWWGEFYIEKFGWIPVDISLAAGLEYEPYHAPENLETYYFGNLDAQHIVFTRGLNELKQTGSNTSIVYRPKTYAFQTIWEESTVDVKQYTSFWNDPVVSGIY